MALSTSNIVQSNANDSTATATNHVVTLPGGTTAGNTLIVIISGGATTPAITAPGTGGWMLDLLSTGTHIYRKLTTAAETSWTFTTVAAEREAWYVAEVDGLDLVSPLDATSSSVQALATGGTATTTAPATTAGLSTMAFAAWVPVSTTAAGATYTFSGWTNGFTEQVDTAGPDPGPGIAVAVGFSTSTIAYSTAATITHTAGGNVGVNGAFVSYREAGTEIVNPLGMMTGFEWGTHGGFGISSALGLWTNSLNPTGTWGTSYLVQAGSARNSAYGMRIVQANATASINWATISGGFTNVFGMNVRMVSGSGIVVVWGISSGPQLVYNFTTNKFGFRASSAATISYQATTTALNTWVWIDWRVIRNSSTWQVDWYIETAANTYTAQTAATLTGQTPNDVTIIAIGSTLTTQTMTVDYDDLISSRVGSTFPLGPHTIRGLTVDPAGTPTTTSPATDFNVFTANGTLAAWNATNARNAVDELPPTVSASADGVVQVAANTAAYAQFPMSTYTLTATEHISGVRAYAAMWSTAAGGSVNFGMRGWDGTNEVVITPVGTAFNTAQPTAYALAAPSWRAGMWPNLNGWSQAELDAANLRVGFSTDIAPGVQALYLEVAVAKTRTRPLFGNMASIEEDPYRYGVVSATVTAPAMGTGATTLEYEEAGTPTTVPVAEGATMTEQINAVFGSDVNRITLEWPPEPDPVD